jgi:hypothetical protein
MLVTRGHPELELEEDGEVLFSVLRVLHISGYYLHSRSNGP